MYPSLPGSEPGPSGRPSYVAAYGNHHAPGSVLSMGSAATTSGGGSAAPPQPGQDSSPWGSDSSTILRVRIADDFRLDPPVPVPPALAASSRPQQGVDFEYERSVMANDASSSLDAFLAKPEDAYYDNTKASRFIRAGFNPAAVNLALAYAAHRGQGVDESQIMSFCENFKTLTQDMSFNTSLAAGALLRCQNDLSAAANLCTELS